MNKYRSDVSSILRRIGFIGLPIIALTVFFFLTRSAEMQSSSASTEQNLVLGKLAFETTVGTQSGPIPALSTANADGTGMVQVATSPPSPQDPSWSPDGLKIVYSANADIFVMDPDGSNKTNLTNTGGASEVSPSWSVTGKIIYERSGQIWIMDANGSNQIQFAGVTQPSPTGPTWSPDGGKIAFASGGEIWKIDANGTNETRVTMNVTPDAEPAWSPDGTRIVFSRGSSNSLGIINANGINEMFFTSATSDSAPSWSPDGTTIAFHRGNSPSGIYLTDVNGENQVRVIGDTETFPIGLSHNDPAWQPMAQVPNTFTISGRITRTNTSLGGVTVNLRGTTNATATTDAAGNYQFSGLAPGSSYTVSPSFLNHFFTPPNRTIINIDGNKIASFSAFRVCAGFVCAQNGKIAFFRNGDIFTINNDGSGQANITNNPGNDTSPNYSPDGTKIIFATDRDGNNEIYRMDSAGTNPARLTNNSASDTSPYHSPDGASIVFGSNRDGNSEIYKMNADGSNQVRLTNNSVSDSAPAFSPDGQKIIYIVSAPMTGMKLFTMNADGSNQQAIPDPGSPFAFYDRPSYSPDGSKIIFTYSADVQSQPRFTWIANADGTNRGTPPNGGLSASYSPDGTKITYNCCTFDNTYRLRTANVTGGSELSLTANGFPPNSPDLPDWQPIPMTRVSPFDFDGDGRSDISVFRPTDRVWYLLRSQAGFTSFQWGLSDDVLTPADYDGDLKTDIAVWRGSSGDFYIFNSFDSTVRVENFGLLGDVPTGGDFDGDSKADLAVYRGGAQGVFYYRASMGNPNGNITSIPWGVPDDIPVAGDYDGDGRTDAAVFRPLNGVWYVRKSSDAQLLANNWGLAGDVLVPADYDGDGKTDFAVFRDGTWYLLRSSLGFSAFQFGISGDVPAPADYDGDGRADVTIYRDGVWWILKSQSGAAEAVSFGLSTDAPVPSAFVR